MPRPHSAMRKIREIIRLRFGEGLSMRAVSASLQIPLTTVTDHVGRARCAGLSWPLPEDLDDEALEARLFAPAQPLRTRPSPDWQKVHNELHRPGVTLMLLWFEYRECFPDGYAYSQFCEHYRRWRRHLDVVMRQSHKAGEKLFVDFPGDKIPIYDPATWEIAFEAELFVSVLGASSYLYAEAVRSQRLEHWVAAHVKALEFYGGCPAILVPRQPRLRGDESPSLRAGRQCHLPGHGRTLWRGRDPGPALQGPGQGQGRSGCPPRRAVDHGAPSQPALQHDRRGQRGDRPSRHLGERPTLQEDRRLDDRASSRRSTGRHFVHFRPSATSSPSSSRSRSTSTTTSRPRTATTTRSPTSTWARCSNSA